MNKTQKIGIAAVAVLWVVLCLSAWLKPADAVSQSERRTLAQFPEISAESMLSGKFMTDFESYTLDQFPIRNTFRTVKALTSRHVLCQRDNNGIYLAENHLAEIEAPLNTQSVTRALQRFSWIYENYLTGSPVFCAVIPDKGYYLAEENGYPAMDYESLFTLVRAGMPWATHIDLTGQLQLSDYYRTDTHWRQERLLPATQKLSQTMGVTVPQAEDFTVQTLDTPFYGVYYGQAALPVQPEEMQLLENEMLRSCRVYLHEKNAYTDIYTKPQSTDLYETYLSGSQSLLTIENPNARSSRELIVFRDSFASALVPLLLQDYRTVTLIDIRYIAPQRLDQFIDFRGQDVLFLYSTLVLNRNLI